MRQIRITILLITCIVLYACPDEEGHYYITIVNKSERIIVFQPYEPRKVNTPPDQDSLFVCGIAALGFGSDTLYQFKCGSRNNWETDLKGLLYIQFLIMDYEIYGKYIGTPCETIRKNVPILHCYRLTLEDLQRMNWTVVYPPEE